MNRCIFVLILMSFSFTIVLGSEITEIPLPELHGLYSYDAELIRNSVFQFDVNPDTIYNAWIKLSGVTEVGLWFCETVYHPVFWRLEFKASLNDTLTGGIWKAQEIIPVDGSFDLLISFTSNSGATWEFLNSGQGMLWLQGKPEHMPPGGSYCYGLSPPWAEVYEAFLVIEADIKVAVENTSWSAIKSLFSK